MLCQGSWVCLWVYSNRFAVLCRSLGLDDCLTDPRFAEAHERQKHWQAFFALVQDKVADRDPDAFVADLQAMNIIAARAYRITELRDSRHLAARGYWRRVTLGGETVVLPGPAFRMGLTPAREPRDKTRCCRLKGSAWSS